MFYTISRYPEEVERLRAEGRLGEIPDVGPTIATIIGEYLQTGTCAKKEEWAQHKPISLLEIAEIDGLGVKMARTLYSECGVDSLSTLSAAAEAGRLDGVKGLGVKTLGKIRAHIEARQ